jgi:hypothetical protein
MAAGTSSEFRSWINDLLTHRPMKVSDVSVASMTLARDAREADRLIVALGALSRLKLPIDVTDGGSNASFVDALRSLPGLNVSSLDRSSGLVAQVRASIARAQSRDRPFILYTEPDKYEFFVDHLARFIEGAPESDDVGIVMASRSASSLMTFPPEQQDTERIFNRLCGAVFRREGDYTYGPFLMRRSLVDELSGADASLGWGWRPYLFFRCVRRGLRVELLTDDYDCPPDQRPESALAYRVQQLGQNVEGLLRATDQGFLP